jgi:amidase
MRRITRNHLVYSLDKAHPPVLTVDPGEVVQFETEDARTGTIQADTDLLEAPPPHGGNPATGPVFIRGAEPGDSLVVEIQHIALDDHGFLAVKRDVGLLRHRATRFATKIIPVRDGLCHFTDRLRFPIRPMVGVIGTAPAGDGVPTMLPGPHGGNMDNNEVRVGARVHLPVAVPGALLAIGDVHASMGDGEVSMVGFEIRAEVTAKVDLQKGETLTRPWIETADGRWVTTGDDPDPVRAMRLAVEEMVNRIMRAWDLSFEEAYMLVTARGDLTLCQACQPGDFPVTTRVSLEKLA